MSSLTIRFEAHGHTARERALCARLPEKVVALLVAEFMKEDRAIGVLLEGFDCKAGGGELFRIVVEDSLPDEEVV